MHRFLIPENIGKKRKEVLRKWYISKASEKIVPRVKKHAHALGVDVAGIRISDKRYRWGSCTLKDNLNFNWRLIKAPMYVIDYVIAHELTHLIEANHTPPDSGIFFLPVFLLQTKQEPGSRKMDRCLSRRFKP